MLTCFTGNTRLHFPYALCRITDFEIDGISKVTAEACEQKAKVDAEAMNAKIKELRNEIDKLELELEDKYSEIDKLKLEYETVRASGMREA